MAILQIGAGGVGWGVAHRAAQNSDGRGVFAGAAGGGGGGGGVGGAEGLGHESVEAQKK
ncbi:hypothetical protein [Vibrio parahaemolyticus]|uniref:hypothetical protein n=1 Tax=Vibrio parahaemolyticus TaxID=670 RepID=UPI00211185FE|nr:hypothetical protein [Vibrio parahaemolyticus]MCQ6498018.1 hypothetical protein [Vibrio parahaemolyticus]